VSESALSDVLVAALGWDERAGRGWSLQLLAPTMGALLHMNFTY
jgi:hypothetical protein